MIVAGKTSLSVGCIGAFFLAAAVSPAFAQVSTVPESQPKLDQLLTQAMDKNPGIIAAKAKLTMAEAELKNVRFEVARQLVACWNDIVDQEQALAAAEEANSKTPGTVSKSVLIDIKAKLSRARSELQFLTGQAPPAISGTSASNAASSTAMKSKSPLQIPRGPGVEKVRKALNMPIQWEFIETPLSDVVDYLKDYHGIEIQLDDIRALADVGIGSDMPVTLNAKGMPLAAAMQLVEDKFAELKFVVRDYGILVTTKDRAEEAGYMPAIEFARQNADGESAAPGTASEAGAAPAVFTPAKSESSPKSRTQR